MSNKTVNWVVGVSGILMILATKVFAASATFKCEPEVWLGDHGISNGTFTGTLTGKCLVTNAAPSGVSSADQYFLSYISHATHVDVGPIEETFETFPSILYRVTDITDQLTIKSDEHIATDGKTKLIYAAFSTDINGSGLASYLRKLDLRVEVNSTPEPTQYEILLNTTISVAKPFFVPGGAFQSQAEKSAKEQYEKRRDKMLPDIVDHL